MELNQLRYFLELKKHEHFSITADYLNISQPALSKSISALENELGVKLFDRIGKQVKINKQGEDFARYCEQALSSLESGMFAVRNSHYDTVGHITILCYTFMPILTPCVSAYARLNPGVTFTVGSKILGEQLKQSQYPDFILRSTPSENNPGQTENFWVSQPLFQERYMLIASTRDPQFSPEQTSVCLKDLREKPFITMLQNNVFFQDVTYSLCQSAGFFPKIFAQTDNIFFKLHMVQEGLAVALLPESGFMKELYPGIRILELEDCASLRTLFLLRQKDPLITEAALDFWNFALDFYHHPH